MAGVVPKARPEIVTWRLIGQSPEVAQRFDLSATTTGRPEPIATRRIFRADRREFGDVPVYDRYGLAPGTRLEGPLILRERESTIVVARPAAVEVLADQTIAIELPPRETGGAG